MLILDSGFAGFAAALELRSDRRQVTAVDRTTNRTRTALWTMRGCLVLGILFGTAFGGWK